MLKRYLITNLTTDQNQEQLLYDHHPAELLIHIRGFDAERGGYPASARLSDGSEFGPTYLTIDQAAASGDLVAAIAYLRPAADFGIEISHMLGKQLQAQITAWQQEIAE